VDAEVCCLRRQLVLEDLSEVGHDEVCTLGAQRVRFSALVDRDDEREAVGTACSDTSAVVPKTAVRSGATPRRDAASNMSGAGFPHNGGGAKELAGQELPQHNVRPRVR
jgi:hypothetical protein